MTWTKRLAPLAVAVAVGVSGVALPASAATTAKPKVWTAAHCRSYKTKFVKRHHGKPTRKQLVRANRVLKRHACKIKA